MRILMTRVDIARMIGSVFHKNRTLVCFGRFYCQRVGITPESKVYSPLTGMCMPLLILTTWKLKREKEAREALVTAFKAGYRAIDIAPHYGNEKLLGNVLQNALCEANLKREDIFIINKLPVSAMKCEQVVPNLCQSLELLKTSYIDLYMINFPAGTCKDENQNFISDISTDHFSIWKAMESTVTDCKAKFLGIANFNCEQLGKLMTCAEIKPSNIQIELHLYMQQPVFRDLSRRLGITVTAYAPFGKSSALVDWLKKKGYCGQDRPNPIDDLFLCKLGKKLCKSSHQVLLRFLLQLDDSMAVVVGGSDPLKITKNFEIFDFCILKEDMCVLQSLDGNERHFDRGVFKYIFEGVKCHPMFPWTD